MDFTKLRNTLEPLVLDLKDAGTHTMLPRLCVELNLPTPPDEGSKRDRLAASLNSLDDVGLPLVARELLLQYPVFTIFSLHTASKRRPKNLIFASPDKPDLRFSDALDNDIEIVTNADKVRKRPAISY